MALGLFIAWTWPVLAWFWQHEPIKAWCVCNGRKLCLLSTVAKLVRGMFFEFVTTKRNGCMMVGGMLHMRFICLHLGRVSFCDCTTSQRMSTCLFETWLVLHQKTVSPVIQNWGEYIVMCSGLNPAVQHIVRANVVTQGLNKNSRIWLVCLSLSQILSILGKALVPYCSVPLPSIQAGRLLPKLTVPVMWFSAILPVRTLTQDAGMPAETRLKNVAHISSADGGSAQHGGKSWHRFRTARNIHVDRYCISVT